MSAITLKNNAVMYKESKKTQKGLQNILQKIRKQSF